MKTPRFLLLLAVLATPLAAQNPVLRDISCADAGATDDYACNALVSPGSYATGVRYMFKANTVNTGAASFNLNGIGLITIKKVVGGVTTDLATNDIRAGQWVLLTHDGTNFQMQSMLGNAPPLADTATALAADPADCSANQFANAINASGTLTCAVLTLAGAQFANQGTTTTVAHGNAAGNPSWSAVVSADITDATIVSADLTAANKTQIKSIALFDPVASDSGRIQMMFPATVTITRVACATKTATSTVSINLDERAAATPDTAGTDVLNAVLVCDTNQQTSCAAGCDVNTITNAGIAVRVPLALTISAVANVPTDVRVHVEFTID